MKNAEFQIDEAVRILSNDGIVAIPTETVYGLAASAYSDSGIAEIFRVKGRPSTNPLIVHIDSINKLETVARNIPEKAIQLAEAFWPGPLTLVLEKADSISDRITAGKANVGVRIPDHELTLELLSRLEFPLVAPSANKSNHISPTSPDHVLRSLGENAPFILNGGTCKKGIESTIVGFEGNRPRLYRLGALSKERIEEVIKVRIYHFSDAKKPLSPGMFKKHYSPKTPLITVEDPGMHMQQFKDLKFGVIYFKNGPKHNADFPFEVLSVKGSYEEAAKNVYHALHTMEQLDLDLIIAELLPNEGVGASVNDRLIRASSKE